MLRARLKGAGPVERWTDDQARAVLDAITELEWNQRPFESTGSEG